MKRLISLIVLLCLCNTGCSKVDKTSQIPIVSTSEPDLAEDTVKLSDIIAPKYEETLAIMFTDDVVLDIDWGASSQNAVVVPESGYPGFGKPMLVIVSDPDGIKFGNTVTLETGYGQFTYLFKQKQDAVLSDSFENVISKTERTEIINFYEVTEKLFIFDTASGECFEYSFSGGTKITL